MPLYIMGVMMINGGVESAGLSGGWREEPPLDSVEQWSSVLAAVKMSCSLVRFGSAVEERRGTEQAFRCTFFR